jgi:type VI secretion system secreted protein VgrG
MKKPLSDSSPLTRSLTVGFLLAATSASAQFLGSAASYGVLGASTVTNTGTTVVEGDIGVSPGTAITGFDGVDAGGPGLFSGIASLGDAAAAQARAAFSGAYVTLEALTFTTDLSGQDLGGLTLTPGVYFFSSSAQLTGALTLDAQNDANARFVFQIGTTLTTASASSVNLININQSLPGGPDNGVYYQVGTSATLGTDTQFVGNLIADQSITLNTGASIAFGRALAINGAVTLDTNRIDASDLNGGFGVTPPPAPMSAVPEPGTFGLFGAGFLALAAALRRRGKGTRPTASSPAFLRQS